MRNPKTAQQAIEKLYRVRQYLIGYTVRDLSLEQVAARNMAFSMLERIQVNF